MHRLLPLAGLAVLLGTLPASEAAAQATEHRTDVQLIRSWEEPVKVGAREELRRVEVAFDYGRGTTVRRVYDASGALLSTEDVAGQPQPNTAEIAEAIAIIEADPELARLLAASGATVEGGFTYVQTDFEDPLAACGDGARCLQFDLVAPNRIESVRFVVVDLATRRVVERDLFPNL